ncbi:Pectate lyase catalytic [Macrophomina phaseolina MS6]|uniref:Pectate lyase catalytic n=1 Tax=Macrophomina phaseolina (strain MS6) TaxID=1126212 RepID=K2SGU3_MACPH|nr:Pectate lyase catalytic [Macrophomina phaseolina MS6]
MVTKIVLEESLGLWLLANARMIKAERCKLKTMKLPAMITPKERSSVLPYKTPELPFLGRRYNNSSKALIESWKSQKQ